METRKTEKKGTPQFMTPESQEDQNEEVVSQKTDVWAIGIIIYMISYFKYPCDDPKEYVLMEKIREGAFKKS